jgi:hypothetical protein
MGLGRCVDWLSHHPLLEIYAPVLPVQPDADFECMSVLMEHTQDVKAITWHPKEEVRTSRLQAMIITYLGR